MSAGTVAGLASGFSSISSVAVGTNASRPTGNLILDDRPLALTQHDRLF
jgi:hypothetical protein